MLEKKLKIGIFIDTFFPMVDGVVMVVDNYAKSFKVKNEIIYPVGVPRTDMFFNKNYIDKAKEAGWLHIAEGDKDYCPDCRKEVK